MKNVVIDTNVFVSALTGGTASRKILMFLKIGRFKLIISEELLTEITGVLSRPKFKFDKNNLDRILRYITRRSHIVFPKEKVSVCRDPKDNIVLECAVAGKADFIVTGDKDLLSLKKFRKTSIISPHQFLKMF